MSLWVARSWAEHSDRTNSLAVMVIGLAGTAHKLLQGQDSSDGFTKLWENGLLELSVEANVLLPWFQELFTDSEIKTAKRRLGDADFDIGQFIKTSPTPDWCDE